MSHPTNTLLSETRAERNAGAYKPEIVYPEGSVIDGNPLISETWLEKEAEEKEREELKNWDECAESIKDIY